jgi:TonB family protein
MLLLYRPLRFRFARNERRLPTMDTRNEATFRHAVAVFALPMALAFGGGCGGGQPSPVSPTSAGPTDSSSAAEPTTPAPVQSAAASTGSAASSATPATASTGSTTWSGATAPAPADRNIDDIRATITSNRDRFRACYDQSQKKHSGIEGKFVLHFVVHPNGTLKAAEVDQAASQIHADDLAACAISVLKTLKFAPSKKGMESTVNYPFDFHPKGIPGTAKP